MISIFLFLGFHIELNILGTRDISCVLHEIQIWNTKNTIYQNLRYVWACSVARKNILYKIHIVHWIKFFTRKLCLFHPKHQPTAAEPLLQRQNPYGVSINGGCTHTQELAGLAKVDTAGMILHFSFHFNRFFYFTF